ncbi:MAG: hypothetical protein GYB53_05215 [Rhodobacteraceae bacterium]|nr:hypothetical protein [Paracoccaceae bacterium]MBR9822088.1 hypothetical protein [Paracoccaceae bacterium]
MFPARAATFPRRLRLCVPLLLALLCLLTVPPARASDLVLPSLLRLQPGEEGLVLTLHMPAAGAPITADPSEQALRSALEAAPPLVLQTARGEEIPLQLVGLAGIAAPTLTLRYTAAPQAPRQRLRVRWLGGGGMLLIQHEGDDGLPRGRLLAPSELSPPLSQEGAVLLPGLTALLAYVPHGFALLLPGAPSVVLFLLGLGFLSFRGQVLLPQVMLHGAGAGAALWLGPLLVPGLTSGWPWPAALIALSTLLVVAGNIAMPRPTLLRRAGVTLFGVLHGLILGERLLQAEGLPMLAGAPALLGAVLGLWLAIAVIFLALHVLLANWIEETPVLTRQLRLPGSAVIGLAALAVVLVRMAA